MTVSGELKQKQLCSVGQALVTIGLCPKCCVTMHGRNAATLKPYERNDRKLNCVRCATLHKWICVDTHIHALSAHTHTHTHTHSHTQLVLITKLSTRVLLLLNIYISLLFLLYRLKWLLTTEMGIHSIDDVVYSACLSADDRFPPDNSVEFIFSSSPDKIKGDYLSFLNSFHSISSACVRSPTAQGHN